VLGLYARSARNLKDVPTAGDVNDRGFRLPERGLRMRMRMNEPAHAIGKEHVHLLRFDQGGYFAFSESLMHQHLPSAICQRRIVRVRRSLQKPFVTYLRDRELANRKSDN
jgi:hypothetical protein